MEGVWATIFICHLIFGGHLLNIPKHGGQEPQRNLLIIKLRDLRVSVFELF